jgi:uncharacterized protein YeaO (DUF488 family)
LALLTKSIYEPREESDGTRVLIARFYPRGVKKERFDRWVRDLSPSPDLLHAYKSGVKSWQAFAAEFKTEIDANPSSMLAIRSLREESRKGNVTLLCYERSGIPCHRYIVAELVKKHKKPHTGAKNHQESSQDA